MPGALRVRGYVADTSRVAASRVGANTCPPMVFPAVLHFTSEPGGRLGELPEASRARHLRGSFPRSRGWNASESGLLSASGRDLTPPPPIAPVRPEENPFEKANVTWHPPASWGNQPERFPPLFPRVVNPERVTNDRCAGAKLIHAAPVRTSRDLQNAFRPLRVASQADCTSESRSDLLEFFHELAGWDRVRFSFPKDSEGFAQHSVVASGSAKRLRRRAPRERLGSRPRSASTSSDLSRRCSRSPLDARPPRRRRRRDRAMSGAPRIPVITEGCRASAAAPRGFAALVTAPAPRGSSSGPRTGPASARRHPAAGATIPQGSTPSTARWPTFTARTSA